MKPADFQELIWNFYERHGRDSLPWRQTDDPYRIYISEMMLQQTQANRVIKKYKDWTDTFPTFESVAQASTKDILSAWQGLGYNRRALYIKEACEIIADKYNGQLPKTEEELLGLPGVGPYTAGALLAFCFGKPVVFVETNIRTVFIHHFLSDNEDITDSEIKKLVGETLPEENIKEWYWALMDYGAHLKDEVGNLNKQSNSYQKQSAFSGSNRQLRSRLTRFIMEHEPVALEEMQNNFSELIAEHERMKSLASNLKALEKEGFVENEGGRYKTSD